MSGHNHIVYVEEHATRFLSERVSSNYKFHNLAHTREVVRACVEIATPYQLSERDMEALLIAAWMHDTGYDMGADGHEARSADYAAAWLHEQGETDEARIEQIRSVIMATKMPQRPTSLLAEILCDADLAHLGDSNYWDRSSKLREEFSATMGKVISDLDWVNGELLFLSAHSFHTTSARSLFGQRKHKHLRQLRKQQLRYDPAAILSLEEIVSPKAVAIASGVPSADLETMLSREKEREKEKEKERKKAEKEKEKEREKAKQLGRGVETMYRTTYNTHINLSSMADNKANQMLSINTIVISIVVSALVPRLQETPRLIAPTVILVCVCLASMVYATLSTRPKITTGNITRKDIEAKRGNLLFFGNYYALPLDDFQFGMKELIKDSDFLYATMTRDLYFLGIVLAKKYRHLSLCYNIFMYGLITSMLAFAVAFVI